MTNEKLKSLIEEFELMGQGAKSLSEIGAGENFKGYALACSDIVYFLKKELEDEAP